MYESPLSIATLAADLINIPSLSGEEHQVCAYAAKVMNELGWKVEYFPVIAERHNLLVTFGTPKILFTTHLDIVPAPPALFSARIEDEILYGRGACDAKGIAATIISAVEKLLLLGANNLGILFVVGEEVDSSGAIKAAKDLQGRGIEYIINGEPTQNKLILSHKGSIDFELKIKGRACHSGYPELGLDANLLLTEALNRLSDIDLGNDSVLGRATLNLGVIKGGVAPNVISPKASIRFLVRSVTNSSSVIEKIKIAVGDIGNLKVVGISEPAHMISVPGFETDVAAFCTDIPSFAPLGAKALLYGPGHIFDAHTDGEKVKLSELLEARDGYVRIFEQLREQIRS
jgi:acetylornithine deacetylase